MYFREFQVYEAEEIQNKPTKTNVLSRIASLLSSLPSSFCMLGKGTKIETLLIRVQTIDLIKIH